MIKFTKKKFFFTRTHIGKITDSASLEKDSFFRLVMGVQRKNAKTQSYASSIKVQKNFEKNLNSKKLWKKSTPPHTKKSPFFWGGGDALMTIYPGMI